MAAAAALLLPPHPSLLPLALPAGRLLHLQTSGRMSPCFLQCGRRPDRRTAVAAAAAPLPAWLLLHAPPPLHGRRCYHWLLLALLPAPLLHLLPLNRE